MSGFVRMAVLFSLAACAPEVTQPGSEGGSPDACSGLACQVATNCAAMNLPATTISGYVYAPNGTLPLYNVHVYIPNGDPGPLAPGLNGTCDRCDTVLPGDPIVWQQTDESGYFSLSDVPTGKDIPLVIVSGKWRRQLVIPMVPACAPLMLDAVDTTLPKSRTDLSPLSKSVDMPQIAISTGGYDALECLILKLGIDPKEITTDTATPRGRINLFADTNSGGEGVDSFAASFTALGGGSGSFSDSEAALWGKGGTTAPDATTVSFENLKQYDVVMFSCEGDQYSSTKAQQDMNAVKQYADFGGRLFLSHWHNIWIEGAGPGAQSPPLSWTRIATFNNVQNAIDPVDTINETANPKGHSFATWMLKVGGSNVAGAPVRDAIELVSGSGRNTLVAIDTTLAEDWVDIGPPPAATMPQMVQFTTPQESAVDQRCGKVVFSDMHVSGDSASTPGDPFPEDCAYKPPAPLSTATMTAQEKALAFMFFDIASCVGPPRVGKSR